MLKCKHILAGMAICLCILLSGCKDSFNPYKHMYLIMTATGYEDLEANHDFVMQHTDPLLQPYISSLFSVITGSSTEEQEIYSEVSGDTTKLLGCYIRESDYSRDAYWAYFEYTNNILTTCHIYPMQPDMPY